MLPVTFMVIFCLAEARHRVYKKVVNTRAVGDRTTLVGINPSYSGPATFRCVIKCDEYASCRAVNDFNNGTCEIVHSAQYTMETDAGSTLQLVHAHRGYICPPGYEFLFESGHPKVPSCYKVVLDKLDWQSMRNHCVSMGGDLISIETAEEQNHIRDILDGNDTLKNAGDYWTSGSDVDVQGSWKWMATGLAVTYNDTFEPNSDVSACIILRSPKNWGWNDRLCDRSVPGICERATEFIKC